MRGESEKRVRKAERDTERTEEREQREENNRESRQLQSTVDTEKQADPLRIEGQSGDKSADGTEFECGMVLGLKRTAS